MFFRKKAEHWLKFKFHKKLNKNENNKEIFAQFSEFKKKIHRIFKVLNEKQIAKWVIQHLIQKMSPNNYFIQFQEHANLIEWNDVALMTIFRRELKDNFKNEIIRDERNYKSLAECIEIIIDLNNKFYERVIKKQYNQFRNRAELIYESAADYTKSKQRSYIKDSEFIESVLMKLKMIHRRKKKF